MYALSQAVFCTTWTFYGSVGYAVHSGPRFLTVYLGPTLAMVAGWSVLRRLGPTIEAAPGVARRTVLQPDPAQQEAQQ